MERIPPETDVAWVVAAVLLGSKEEIAVLQATKTENSVWKEQTLDLIILGIGRTTENMVETVTIGDVVLRVGVEGRTPRCFKCG